MDQYAVITGARGQNASYLAEFLLAKGYRVVGVIRRSSCPNNENILHLFDNPNFIIEQGDITDSGSISRIVSKYKPKFYFNLAAQSYVGSSWNEPISTWEINTTAVMIALENIRQLSPETRFYQASSSEVYGDVLEEPQDLETPANPLSPYGASKYAAEQIVNVYRQSYGLFACFSRNFNNESPRRGRHFVTRKITSSIAEMWHKVDKEYITQLKKNAFISAEEAWNCALSANIIEPIRLGNLDAKRDWTHTKNIIDGIWLMMNQDCPDSFLFASGENHSIREFLDLAFAEVGIKDWSPFVTVDPKFFRPADVNTLCGDYSKAEDVLGWTPKTTFEEMVSEMVQSDIHLQEKNVVERERLRFS